jgi:lactoylglutathione lyase
MDNLSLTLVVLRSPDIERAATFYRGLGLALTTERHGTGPIHYSCALGETILELYPATAAGSERPTDGVTRLGFAVPSLADALHALEALGVVIPESAARGPGAALVVRDPDGRAVELTERPAPPGR